MDGYSYRHLGVRDLALLREMNGLFAAVFSEEDAEEADTYLGAPPDNAYLRALLESRHFIALAALAGDRVVGGLVAYEMRKFERARSEIYAYDLAVAPDHRRNGVATGLMTQLKAVARERGAWVIMIQADGGNEPAVAFYSRLGTREDIHHFEIDPEGQV